MHVIGDYSFDVLSHQTVKANGGVTERFVVDAYYQGKPLPWHPNQKNADDFPGLPNRQIFEWVGRESRDVYNDLGQKVGTKRGANFGTDGDSGFFSILMLKAEKAHVASESKKAIGEVTDAELVKATFVAPVDLKALPLDRAGSALVTKAADVGGGK